jgi:thiol-disulfide isomerase/thioredoxin
VLFARYAIQSIITKGELMMKKKFLTTVFFVAIAIFIAMAANAAQAQDMPDVFPAFSSRSLEGKTITESIFSGKKLTMVNIWTTWCPPCIGEMPDLGVLGRSMPEGSQLVGIILDVEDPETDSETIGNAKRILKRSRADFPQIFPVDEIAPVLDEVEAIPTTIFVDSQGKIVGSVLVGARSEKEYRSEVENILKSMK